MPITITYTNGSNSEAEEIIDKEDVNPFKNGFDWTARVGTTYTEIDLIYKNSIYYTIFQTYLQPNSMVLHLKRELQMLRTGGN